MKTILKIEIETPDTLGVYDETKDLDSQTEEYKEKSDKDFCKDLHKEVVEYFKDKPQEIFKDDFEDGEILEEFFIEDWESIEDYKIKINISKE